MCVSTVAPKSGRDTPLPPLPPNGMYGLGTAFPVRSVVGFGGGCGEVPPRGDVPPARVGGGGIGADKWLDGLDGAAAVAAEVLYCCGVDAACM